MTARLAKPPSRGLLLLVGFGGLALAAGAVSMFFANRDRVLRAGDDAAIPAAIADADVRSVIADAAAQSVIDNAAPGPVDALVGESPDDAASVRTAPTDAAAKPQNVSIEPRDAGVRRSDAGRAATEPRRDAGVRGTAKLQVGAIPWGEIYIDGKLVGRTPRELTVSAGKHTVEIVFPAETPPRKQTFSVDLEAGETKPLQADFSP